MNEKELSAKIEKLRCELKELVGQKKSYTDPEIIAKSKELDRAINALMRLPGETNKKEE